MEKGELGETGEFRRLGKETEEMETSGEIMGTAGVSVSTEVGETGEVGEKGDVRVSWEGGERWGWRDRWG